MFDSFIPEIFKVTITFHIFTLKYICLYNKENFNQPDYIYHKNNVCLFKILRFSAPKYHYQA